MKKIIVIFVILFVSTNVWAARGVDCSNIKEPNLSTLGFQLYDKVVYQNKRAGASIHYDTGFHLLSYYSYDAGLDVINQEELDRLLDRGVNDIMDRYSKQGTLGEGDVVRKEENYILQDDAKYLSMKLFDEFGMQKFVNQGVYMTSVQKNSSEPIKKLEIITIGTDGYCIHKVRWTRKIFPENESTDLYPWLESFALYLRDFYKLFIKLNSN